MDDSKGKTCRNLRQRSKNPAWPLTSLSTLYTKQLSAFFHLASNHMVRPLRWEATRGAGAYEEQQSSRGRESNRSQDVRGGWAESYIKHLLDHSHTLERSPTGRQGRKKGEIRKGEEEASLDGWGSCPFTLIASAVSDGEEINMPLTICTPIHLPLQHTARVSATVGDDVCRLLSFFLFLNCRVQSLETPTLSPWPLPNASVFSGTSDEDFLE